MPLLTTAKFELKSETNTYAFDIYSLEHQFNENYGGVYVFTKRTQGTDGKFFHNVIYIGKANCFNERFNSHEKWADIVRNGANCICIFKTASEAKSLEIEKAILLNNNTPLNVHHN